MRKTSIVVLLSIGMLSGLWLLPSVPANAQMVADAGLQQFSGTAWIVYRAPGLPPLPGLFTFHPDGTLIGVDGSDEGLGGAVSVNSAVLGVYKRSGPRQTTNRSIYLSYEDTIPVAAFVNDSVSDWNNDFSGGTGVLQQRRYDLLAGENPLDPNQGTPWGDPIPYQFWTLQP